MPTSETSKYRHLTAPYCVGAGVDVGSSGDPVVPHAIQIDLESPYCPLIGPGPIHIKGDGTRISTWFTQGSLNFIYSSHLIEDFLEWRGIINQWDFCLARGGHMIILAPEKHRWQHALAMGQPPNEAHRHEPILGELTKFFAQFFPDYKVIMDECPDPADYGIVFIARKL